MITINRRTDALVHVDVQTTFMPAHTFGWRSYASGGLAVPCGWQILPVVLRVQDLFDLKYATVDHHPRGHISFASSYVGVPPMTVLTREMVDGLRIAPHARFGHADLCAYLECVGHQVLWPDHALAGTPEGELHPALAGTGFHATVFKGTDPLCDSYSGIKDNLGRPTGLAGWMRADGVRRVFIDGLAFDFCVGWTALDAVAERFESVYVIEDGTRSVDIPGDPNADPRGTVEKMRQNLNVAGVSIIRASELE